MLRAADDALEFAAKVKAKKSPEVDEKFECATEMLHSYGTDWHPKDPGHRKSLIVKERMAAAKEKDGEGLLTLNRLKEKTVPLKEVKFKHATFARAQTESQKRTMVVEFLILKSLPEKSPTVVRRSTNSSIPLSI